MLHVLPWVIAVALVAVGVIAWFSEEWLLGTILVILGLLVGPGGIRIFNTRRK